MKHVASDADLLLVVGSDNSSNSNRLVEVARNLGTGSHLIDSFRNIRPEWLEGVKTIALTAGASAPECLVEEVVKFLGTEGFANVQEVEVMPENVRFGLPPEIVEAIAAAPSWGGCGVAIANYGRCLLPLLCFCSAADALRKN